MTRPYAKADRNKKYKWQNDTIGHQKIFFWLFTFIYSWNFLTYVSWQILHRQSSEVKSQMSTYIESFTLFKKVFLLNVTLMKKIKILSPSLESFKVDSGGSYYSFLRLLSVRIFLCVCTFLEARLFCWESFLGQLLELWVFL